MRERRQAMKEYIAGRPVRLICIRYGVSKTQFFEWHNQDGIAYRMPQKRKNIKTLITHS